MQRRRREPGAPVGDDGWLGQITRRIELMFIREALFETYGNKTFAAELLGISRGTIHRRTAEDESQIMRRVERAR